MKRIIGFLFFYAFHAHAAQIDFPVEKYQLPNGLTVLLHEDSRAPIVSLHIWFRVGSKDEEPQYTGIAHLFEHMMFKGAKRYKAGEFDKVLQANGAVNNAFTSHDFTGYYENFPSSKLELMLDIESDRMQNLQVTDENLQSEREVVKEERRYRVDNDPMGLMREVLYGLAFRVHPYGWPVIGYMADINRINLEKSREFYRMFYAPNNAVMVVAGDISKGEAKRWIRQYFGSIPSQPIQRRDRKMEPFNSGGRSQTLNRHVQSPTVTYAYQAPPAGQDDAFALDLAASILAEGTASRMHRRLVYSQQVATSVFANNHSLQEGGLFQVRVNLKPGVSVDVAQKAILADIWKLRNQDVSSEELDRAKKQMMVSYVDALKTVNGKAEALALNEILFNDYSQLFKALDRYQNVKIEDVRRVSNKYLTPARATEVILQPAQPRG